MKKDIISLGGLPGSGKSTVKGLIAKEFGWSSFSTGDFMRKMAHDRGISFDEFNALIAHEKSIDEQIDAELIRIEQTENNIIIDSHLAFHFVPSSFKIFLNVSLETSASRIYLDGEKESRKSVGDVMGSVTEASARIKARIDNHNDRYVRFYGVSPYDTTQYDLVIDTEQHTQFEVASIINTNFHIWKNQ